MLYCCRSAEDAEELIRVRVIRRESSKSSESSESSECSASKVVSRQ